MTKLEPQTVFLDNFLFDLVGMIRTCIASPRLKSYFYYDYILMPAVDLLVTLSRHYELQGLVSLDEINRWQNTLLNTYDKYITENVSDVEFINERRQVIQETFEKLKEFA